MSDTPETDAAWKEGNAIREWTCRKLERERDEAREALRTLAEHGENEIQKLIKECDEAREKLENEMKWHHETHKELIEAQCKLLDIEYDKLKS